MLSWLRVQLLFQELVSKLSATASKPQAAVSHTEPHRQPSPLRLGALGAPEAFSIDDDTIREVIQNSDAPRLSCDWSGTEQYHLQLPKLQGSDVPTLRSYSALTHHTIAFQAI